MTTYGRNFEFRVPPRSGERSGRYYNAEGAALPIGVPVTAKANTVNSLGLQGVELANAAADIPKAGQGGILVYEYGPAAYAGDDPMLTTYSDKDVAPDGAAVQVVSGDSVKVVLRNTTATSFLTRTGYPAARKMIVGLGATLSLAVGDMLTPGTGNDTDGYWAETNDATKAWLVVTKVDNARGEVEARLNF